MCYVQVAYDFQRRVTGTQEIIVCIFDSQNAVGSLLPFLEVAAAGKASGSLNLGLVQRLRNNITTSLHSFIVLAHERSRLYELREIARLLDTTKLRKTIELDRRPDWTGPRRCLRIAITRAQGRVPC